MHDMIEDERQSVENDLEYIYMKELVGELLNTPSLTEKEKEVLTYRFGFYDGKPKTLEEIGKIYNVGRERIRQIEGKALRKLKNPHSKFYQMVSEFQCENKIRR